MLWSMSSLNIDANEKFEERKMWFDIIKPWLNPMMFSEQQKEGKKAGSDLPEHKERRTNFRYDELIAQAKYEMRRMSEAKRGR